MTRSPTVEVPGAGQGREAAGGPWSSDAPAILAMATSLPFAGIGTLLAGAHALGLDPAVPCPLSDATGVPCPACGVTRAASSLLRGDVDGMVAQWPGMLLTVLLAVMALVSSERLVRRRPLPRPLSVGYLAALVSLLALNTVWQLATS